MNERDKQKRALELIELIFMNKFEINESIKYEIWKLMDNDKIDYDELEMRLRNEKH